ncbi:MAG: DUF5698 domain-containing protein [Acidobacteriota bacterium]
MDFIQWFGSDGTWALVFPLLIFLARVCDVTLGTLRMVFVARGEKGTAAFLGFFEVLIWLSVISYILQNLTAVSNYLAYAAGFATGNYLGLKIEEKMALGLLGVTVITNRDARELIEHLTREKYGITSVSAMGAGSPTVRFPPVVEKGEVSRDLDSRVLIFPMRSFPRML